MNKAKPILLALAAALVITALIALGPLHRLDKLAQDQLFQRPGVTDTNILIIGIDEDALDLLGPYNTWDRSVMAQVLEALASNPDSRPAVVAIDTMYSGERTSFEKPFSYNTIEPSEKHIRIVRKCNTEYLAQLYALKAWYREIRMKRSMICGDEELSLVYTGALETLDECVKERLKRYKSFASQWGTDPFNDACMHAEAPAFAGVIDWKTDLPYDKWIWSLSAEEKSQLHDWLASCADMIKNNL